MEFSPLQTYQEKEADKKMKQRARERMQPKMGKLDIDYQVRCACFSRCMLWAWETS